MAGTIYSSTPGTVAVVRGSGVPAIIKIDGFSPSHRAIITNLTFSQAVNAQLLQTLQDHVYLYSFGDRIGQLGIGGLTFLSTCSGNDTNGLNYVLNWFWRNRVSAEGTPVSVALAGFALKGFLVSVNVGTASTEFQTFSFSYDINTLP